MISESFSVRGMERLIELQSFVRENMPTARFVHNQIKIGNDFHVTLTYEVSDLNKLNILFNKFHEEDNPPKPKKLSFFEKLMKVSKFGK